MIEYIEHVKMNVLFLGIQSYNELDVGINRNIVLVVNNVLDFNDDRQIVHVQIQTLTISKSSWPRERNVYELRHC